MRMRFPKRLRLAVLVVVFVCVVWWSLFGGKSPIGGTYNRSTVAIVVLGMQLHSDMMPRMSLKQRVLHAAKVWRNTSNGLLILSGARKNDLDALKGLVVTEASTMKDIAVCAGVPSSYIWLEERASNTVENAFFSVALLNELANFSLVKDVVVVTSEWHVARARVAFELLVPPALALRMEGAPDATGRHDERSDLALLPATWRDVVALPGFANAGPGTLALAAARRLFGARAVVLLLPGASAWEISSYVTAAAACGEATGALAGPIVGVVDVCAAAPRVLCEAHEELARRLPEVTAAKLAPVSSTTWLFLLTCKTVKERITKGDCVLLN